MDPLVLDSNVLIYHLKHEPVVLERLQGWLDAGNRLFISAITRIELLAAPVMQPDEEQHINRLLDQFFLIPVDKDVATIAARVRRTTRIELGDSIIAASTLIFNATLVTRNVRDFKKVPNLSLLAI